MSVTSVAQPPDRDVPHIVGPTRRVAGSGMYATSCICGATVHDVDRDASAAALNAHRNAGAERAAKLAADVPSFTAGGNDKP